MLPLVTALDVISIKIIVTIEIIVVVDVHVAAVPIAIAPVTTPSAPGSRAKCNASAPR
jgi:hypothetical protein